MCCAPVATTISTSQGRPRAPTAWHGRTTAGTEAQSRKCLKRSIGTRIAAVVGIRPDRIWSPEALLEKAWGVEARHGHAETAWREQPDGVDPGIPTPGSTPNRCGPRRHRVRRTGADPPAERLRSWCWSLAGRAAPVASGDRYAAGVVIGNRPLADGAGSVPAPWRRSGENRREAPVRGRRWVSLALPPFLFHCPPCAPLPWFIVRAAPLLSGAVEPEVTRREIQASGSALASTLLAALRPRVAARPDPLRAAGELTPPACEASPKRAKQQNRDCDSMKSANLCRSLA